MSRQEDHPGADEGLAALYAAPFAVRRPIERTAPFIFASPHSGHVYPASFIRASRLGATALRRSEDAFVDELFAGAVALGAPMIAARFPRAYCDANRSASEIDRAMFDGALSLPIDNPSPRVSAGLGVIPRIVRDGAEIYRGKLAAGEAEARLAHLYRPYHAALSDLIEETLHLFGVAVIVDCHSMPSAAAVPDIVLGDRYGASASAILTRWAEDAFGAAGFGVARNAPYAGGHTTHLYGQRERNCHALQVEINRTLYLDEERIEPNAQFGRVTAHLNAALARLVAIDPALLRRHRPPSREAAE